MFDLKKAFEPIEISSLAKDPRTRIVIIKHPTLQRYGALLDEISVCDELAKNGIPIIAKLPSLYPEYLGSFSFLSEYHLRFPYIVGEMANGIASAEMVISANKCGLLGSFGAAGLIPNKIESNLNKIISELGQEKKNWSSNLIYNINEPEIEKETAELYLRMGIVYVSASAYMNLTPYILRYAFSGISLDSDGNVLRKNRILAKLSHPSVAKIFISPPPEEMLRDLVEQRWLTSEEAELASQVPIAEDITVEADSGGHTDRRPLTALFPVIKQMAREAEQRYNYKKPIRVGAAGGLGTPSALSAAFAMGADYVLTGSVNESTVEADISPLAKEMLAKADLTDVAMAPAADMFELGIQLQVLKKGTMFSPRAKKLYEFYQKYSTIEELSESEKSFVEKEIFREHIDVVWEKTRAFFQSRDPKQIEMAHQNKKYKMALIFRSYLGQSSRWAIMGDLSRVTDYQIWCGPAMGSFNEFVKGTFLEKLENRTVKQVAYNLLEGAAVLTRMQQLRSFGIAMHHTQYKPKPFK